MKALIMAAGYGTRLYPITKNTPKPLLEVGGQPMIDHVVDKIKDVEDVNELLVVTNDKFYDRFLEWRDETTFPWPVTVLNDGSTEDGEKRGAIGDIQFTIDQVDPSDDLMVLAGDNLFDFSLEDMVDTFQEVNDNVIGVLQFEDESKLSKYGIVEIDEDNEVVQFQEKPDNPPSNLVAMGMYLFPGEKLTKIQDYLNDGGNPDEPGWYITWLVENDQVYAHPFEGNWFDIGDKDSLDKADEFLKTHSIR
ncbi:MAG: NDP-sugar synthase [bacterium]